MNVIEVSKKKVKSKEKRRKRNILFIDFSSAYLSIFFTTYDLLDGIQRDYNNKAISSNWMRWAKWRGEIVFECAVFMAHFYITIFYTFFLFSIEVRSFNQQNASKSNVRFKRKISNTTHIYFVEPSQVKEKTSTTSHTTRNQVEEMYSEVSTTFRS
jgi:hypothetical protein